jgi:hypothetical protein
MPFTQRSGTDSHRMKMSPTVALAVEALLTSYMPVIDALIFP